MQCSQQQQRKLGRSEGWLTEALVPYPPPASDLLRRASIDLGTLLVPWFLVKPPAEPTEV